MFSADGTGAGDVRALHLSDGSAETPASPATRGSVVRLLATGLGMIDAPGQPERKPLLPVSVSIGKMNSPVQHVAPVPSGAGDLFEIDVVVPESLGAGSWPVSITAGQTRSEGRVTLAVK